LSIWIVLWLVLSTVLLYFLGWTIFILLKQKQVWKTFAHKNKLRYQANKFLSSPEMSGIIHDYTISFFTGEHTLADARNSRKMTAIEVSLSSRMPFEGAIASGGMVPIARSLGLKEEYAPEYEAWDKTWIVAGANRNALEAYLTPERLKYLSSLMKLKNAWVIMIFRDETMLLRLDTPDPLDSEEKLNNVSKMLTNTAQALELGKGEDGRLKHVLSQPQRKTVVIAAPPEESASLELEGEDLPKDTKE
jgi:hypothetical protein